MEVDAERRDIWRFARYFQPQVAAQFRLTLGEGGTPLLSVPRLARALNVGEVLLKRDDLSPGGSHKARSLAYRVSLAGQRGEPALAISSSGNAAVAAGMYGALAGLRLFAFVSPATNPEKLRWLRRENVVIITSPRPRNLARYAGRLFGIPNLTPSLDDFSIEGFKSIAGEIAEQAGHVDHLFTFVTSGSSLVGMARMFSEIGGGSGQPSLSANGSDDGGTVRVESAQAGPALHAVQAGSHPAVAGPTDRRWQRMVEAGSLGGSQIAGLLGVEDTPRAEEARRWLETSGGYGWVALDEEILACRDLLAGCGIDTSPEGCACLSAAKRARSLQVVDSRARVVIVLTGHGSQWPLTPSASSSAVAPEIRGEAPIEPDHAETCCELPGQEHSKPQEEPPPLSQGTMVHVESYSELRKTLGQWLPEVRNASGPRDL